MANGQWLIAERRKQLLSPFSVISNKRVIRKVGFQGLRTSKNRSLLVVNEDFEKECNAEITLYYYSYFCGG